MNGATSVLRYKIIENNVENRDRMSFDTLITVEQGGKNVTQIAIRFTVFLAEKIEVKEREQAQLLLRKMCITHPKIIS